MLVMTMALALAAVQDQKPLAGYLPPAPRPLPREKGRDDRPHGKAFISPMGEPFRGDDPVRAWFDGADANHDGALSKAEFVADAMRFFAVLDRGKDGEIDPDDIDFYETRLAPEIRAGGGAAMGGGAGGKGGRGRGRGGGRRGGGGPPGGEGGGEGGASGRSAGPRYDATKQGAARYGFFDYPEPVVVADTNFNRGVDAREFKAAALDRFAMLDKNHDGVLTRGELPRIDLPRAGEAGFAPPGADRGGPRRGEGAPRDEE